MRKLKLIDKIILIGVAIMAGFILLLFFSGKRKNRDFYLPPDFEGWVKIKHSVPGAPPLPEEDGIYQLHVPDSAYIETSTPLKGGWGRDRFFTQSSTGPEPIPAYLTIDDETHFYIHEQSSYPISYESLLPELPDGVDTTFWDGTEVEKQGRRVIYTPGKNVLEYFYVSRKAQPLGFRPPKNPDQERLISTEDRELPSP